MSYSHMINPSQIPLMMAKNHTHPLVFFYGVPCGGTVSPKHNNSVKNYFLFFGFTKSAIAGAMLRFQDSAIEALIFLKLNPFIIPACVYKMLVIAFFVIKFKS